jgi:diacylglycerol kinase (ATP)
MPSLALLANTESGDGRAEEVEAFLRELGAEVATFPIEQRERALETGPDRIAVAGGDGSIAYVAACAARGGKPLAVIPTGTANDFASGVGLPKSVEEACALAVDGRELRSMELGWAGERPFVNLASAGLSPVAAEHADGLKGRLGALAYPLGAIRAGATARPLRCRVDCDEQPFFEGEAWQVSIACTGAFGGGASLETDAGDGRLDLVVIERGSRIRLVQRAYGMRAGRVERQRGVRDGRCDHAELSLPPSKRLNVDGELVGAGELGRDGSIAFRADADAFRLVVG